MRVPQERLDRIRYYVETAYARLEGSQDSPAAFYDVDAAMELIAEIATVPARKAGGPYAIRVLKKARKDSSPAARVLIGWYWWHGSGGSLWGPMGRFGQWDVTAAESDALNSLALILRGGASRASDTWSKAIGRGA